MKYYKWNDEKLEILKSIYPSGNMSLLMEKLQNFSIDSIRHKASELGIKVDGDYSDEDVKFLLNNYDKFSLEELAKKLNRTVSGVYTKINNLGLKYTERWSEEELNLLEKVYPIYTNKYLVEKYFPNRKSASIRTMALKHGWHKSSDKSVKWYDQEKMILQLIELGKLLGRTPRTCELVLYNLPSEPSYRRYFGSYLNACELADLDVDYSFFGIDKKYYYSSNGDRCFSKAELTITDFLISKNISYKKEEMYKNYIQDERCGLKRVDWVIGNNVFVEYFGMPEKSYYYEKMQIKREICINSGIELVEIFFKDINKLNIVFERFIN